MGMHLISMESRTAGDSLARSPVADARYCPVAGLKILDAGTVRGKILIPTAAQIRGRGLHPISHCRLKHVKVYACESFELDAIAAHGRLA